MARFTGLWKAQDRQVVSVDGDLIAQCASPDIAQEIVAAIQVLNVARSRQDADLPLSEETQRILASISRFVA